MPSCSIWPLRVLGVSLAYVISMYMLYEAISRFTIAIRPGVEILVATIIYHAIILVVLAASTIVIFYSTGSLVAVSAILLGYLALTLPSPYRLILLIDLIVVLVLLTLLIGVRAVRGGLIDPLVDLTVNPRVSPTALASTALTLYVSWNLIPEGYATCEVSSIYALSSLTAAVIASLSSSSILESLILGGLAGLGPLGLALTAAYASFKPLRPPRCSGVKIGELVGFTEVASPSRALIQARGGGRTNIMVCSQPSDAILELREPWILWVYGVESLEVAYSVARSLGGGLVLRLTKPGLQVVELESKVREAIERASKGEVVELNLGSIEPTEVRLALTPSIAETASNIGALIIEPPTPVHEETLLRAIYETVRRHNRVIVTLQEIPWKEHLTPRGPARTTGLIVTRLTDPLQAETIARTLLPRQEEKVKEAILKGEIKIAYPGCNNKTIAIKTTHLSTSPKPHSKV